MELQPVRRVRKPDYPPRADLLHHPECARRLGTRRPGAAAGLATAAGMLLAMGLGACRERPSASSSGGAPELPGSPGTPPPRATARTNARPTIELAHTVVAPVFEFGDGRGTTGCMVVAPPAFLSEEEAMLVIKEELAQHGIHLGPGGPLPGVSVAPRVRTTVGGDDADDTYDIREDTSQVGLLQVDGTDADAAVSVVFVSSADYPAVGVDNATTWRVDARGHRPPEQVGSWISVSTYDFREAAHYVAVKAADKGLAAVRLGVFYDPSPEYDDARESAPDAEATGTTTPPEVALKAKASELLRMQVRSFATWLEAQDAEG
jgi:hypothetical protein